MNFSQVVIYFKLLFVEARTKLTTYLALATVIIAELPNIIDQGTLNSLDFTDITRRHVAAGLAILTIWSRVRRDIRLQLLETKS